MRISRRPIVVTVICMALFALGTVPASADPFKYKKLSNKHLLFGVSQFNAGNINARVAAPLKLFNPTPVTMAVAALLYERESDAGKPGGISEQYLGCLVRVLTPHGAVQASLDSLPFGPLAEQAYVEVISAPVAPVGEGRKKLRLADGLGIRATGTLTNKGSVPLAMVNPLLFTLPSDDVVQGQRQDAINCVCKELEDSASSDPDGFNVFEDFGISCLK